MEFISLKKVFFLSTSLLLFLAGDVIAQPIIEEEINAKPNFLLDSTVGHLAQNPHQNQTRLEVKQVSEYLDEGDLHYQNRNYSDAENSYRNAWDALQSRNIGTLNFRIPKERRLGIEFETNINIGNIIAVGVGTIFGIQLDNISIVEGGGNFEPVYRQPKTARIDIKNSLDDLHAVAVNFFAQGTADNLFNQENEENEANEVQTPITENDISSSTILRGKRDISQSNDIVEILNYANSQSGRQRLNRLNYAVEDIEDTHKIEVKILRKLQQSLVAQNQENTIEKALEIAQLSRNRELVRFVPAIAYALDNKVQNSPSPNNLNPNDNGIQNPSFTDREIPDLSSPEKLDIADIKKIAKAENSTLVYYSIVSPSQILIWVIRPSGDIYFRGSQISEQSLPMKSLVEKTLQSASKYIDRGEDDKALIQALRDINLRIASNYLEPSNNIQDWITTENEQKTNFQKLHQILIEPVREFLPSNPEEQLVFLPQGSLFSVPFVALQDENGSSLIDRHTVRVAVNLNSLKKRPSLAKFPQGDRILVVGDPDYQYPSQIPPLPGAFNEAIEIATLTQSRIFTRHEATLSAIEEELASADVLHFATHGLLDSQSPIDLMLIQETSRQNSSIIRVEGIANDNSSSRGVWYNFWYDSQEEVARHIIRTSGSIPGKIAISNSFLTAEKILNMRLNAKLAVLSACNTGQGIVNDSTIFGLPFSLGIAGIPRVVVSLWSVPDRPTQILMLEFYKAMQTQEQLGQKIDEAQALRQAMLKVKAILEYRDPINWAGFTLMEVSHQNRES